MMAGSSDVTTDPGFVRAVLETVGALVVVLDRDARIVLFNHACQEATGYAFEEVRGRELWFLLRPEEMPGVRAVFADLAAGRFPSWHENDLVRRSGEPRRIAWSNTAVLDSSGRVEYVVGTGIDVTERRQAEERLRMLRQIDRAILRSDSISELIAASLGTVCRLTRSRGAFLALCREHPARASLAIADAEGGSEFRPDLELEPAVREEIEHLCGSEATPGAPLRSIALGLLPAGTRSYLGAALERQGHRIGCLVLASGREAAYGVEDRRTAVEAAHAIAIALLQAELHEKVARHAAELETRVAERTAELGEMHAALGALSYSLSQDLTAPTRAMVGFSQALLEDYSSVLDETGRDYLRRVAIAASRMSDLIEGLQAYSRLARRPIELEPAPLETAVETALLVIAREERQVEVGIERPLPPVRAHMGTLVEVLGHLLSNAVRFVPPERTPRIRIRAETIGPSVRTWIEDNGIGISPEDRDRIFGLFERLGDDPGAGVGLALARKGTERMGGRIGFESTPGQGSRFWVELARA